MHDNLIKWEKEGICKYINNNYELLVDLKFNSTSIALNYSRTHYDSNGWGDEKILEKQH